MIELQVDQASVNRTIEHLQAVRLKIFAAVRVAMKAGMEELAGVAVVEMGAAGIQSRTGRLAENILKSPQIRETQYEISGRVTAKAPMTIGGRTFSGYLGTALDEGYSVPEVQCNMHQITEANGESFWTHGHVAFAVRPHPFLRAASASYAPTLIELIRDRIYEAIGTPA